MAGGAVAGVVMTAARSLVPVIAAAGPLAAVATAVAGAGILCVHVWSRRKGQADDPSQRSGPVSEEREAAVATGEFNDAEIGTPAIRVRTSSSARTARLTERLA